VRTASERASRFRNNMLIAILLNLWRPIPDHKTKEQLQFVGIIVFWASPLKYDLIIPGENLKGPFDHSGASKVHKATLQGVGPSFKKIQRAGSPYR
jgi:hypothetical protein